MPQELVFNSMKWYHWFKRWIKNDNLSSTAYDQLELIITVDENRTITDVTASNDTFNYIKKGKTLFDAIPSFYKSQVAEIIQFVFETGTSKSILCKLPVHKSENLYALNIQKFNQGLCLLFYRSNPTDRTLPSHQLETARFKSMADKFNYGLTIFEHDHAVYVNERIAEICGYTTDELLNKTIFDLTIPEDRKRVNAEVNKIIKQKSNTSNFRFWIERKDGSRRCLSNRYSSISDGIYFMVTRDVTERVFAERELVESEKQYRLLIDSLGDAIHMVDRDLRLVMCNKFLVEWNKDLGLELDIIGKSLTDIYPFLTDAVVKEYQQVLKYADVLITEEVTILNNTRFYTETRKIPVIEEGKVAYVITILRDITKRKEIEERLQFSDRIIVTTNNLIVVADGKGDIVYTSPAIKRILGYSSEEMLGSGWWNLTKRNKEEIENEKNYLRNVLAGKSKIRQMNHESVVFDRKGNPHNILWQDAIGPGDTVIGIGMDITDRKVAENKLQQSRQMLQLVLDTIPVRVFWKDLKFNYLGCNELFAKDAGLAKSEQILGKNDFELGWKEQAKLYRMDDKEVMESGKSKLNYEEPQDRPEGKRVWLRTSKIPLRENNRDIVGVLGTYEDITDKKEAERAIIESAEKIRSIFDTVVDGIIVADLRGTILDINDTTVKLARFHTKGDLIGKKISQFLREEDTTRALRHFKQLLQKSKVRNLEYVFVTKDGQEVPVEVSGALLKGTNGDSNGVVIVIKDISERRNLEVQLIQAQKMEAIGRLAGGIAHDFNNWLTVIQGYSELLLTNLDPGDPIYQNIKQIHKAGERAESLTRQLLAFSRRQVMQTRVLDLNQLIKDMEKMLKRLLSENIEFITVLDSNLQNVKTDPAQIEHVIMNIVVNARDAMPDGGRITIRSEFITDASKVLAHYNVQEDKPFIKLSISDTGLGMSKETQAHIFEPFFTTKDKGEGTGLGLATVYGIIKQSEGFVTVDSAVNQGSTFNIFLPAVPGSTIEDIKKVDDDTLLRGTETVLVVEDEEEVRRLVCDSLAYYGYRVLEAANGGSALLTCEQFTTPIDLMLTDIIMPQMSGQKLAERLNSLHSEMKVLYMSGYSDVSTLKKGILNPETNFIQKPFSPKTLIKRVRQILDHHT
jgi:two-component system cell cycle sensor histidine kinase/response regulator CckA